MNRRERELRKTLLLVKGDALRMQLGLELQQLQHTLSLTGLLGRLLPQLIGLGGRQGGRRRGWWRILRLLFGSLGIWRTLSGWFKSR
ncbi:hypothetical protein THUN1379_05280 [Paludibacterium sp. THUN1379]|uniref:hypothetical protein n=1 Tax=Paludibacterium sp. THUN1379 TaxID=3112107 RepID=UPI00308C176A|nr:hypothetical protein THUN1379_05280 [Paludibacterium sp. THUN1379]